MVALIVVLLLLALLFGGLGIFVEGLTWLLIIALIVLGIGIIMGVVGRGRRTTI